MNEPAKNGIGKEPVPVSSADVPPEEIIRKILGILHRNQNGRFLQIALTKVSNLEKAIRN